MLTNLLGEFGLLNKLLHAVKPRTCRPSEENFGINVALWEYIYFTDDSPRWSVPETSRQQQSQLSTKPIMIIFLFLWHREQESKFLMSFPMNFMVYVHNNMPSFVFQKWTCDSCTQYAFFFMSFGSCHFFGVYVTTPHVGWLPCLTLLSGVPHFFLFLSQHPW